MNVAIGAEIFDDVVQPTYDEVRGRDLGGPSTVIRSEGSKPNIEFHLLRSFLLFGQFIFLFWLLVFGFMTP